MAADIYMRIIYINSIETTWIQALLFFKFILVLKLEPWISDNIQWLRLSGKIIYNKQWLTKTQIPKHWDNLCLKCDWKMPICDEDQSLFCIQSYIVSSRIVNPLKYPNTQAPNSNDTFILVKLIVIVHIIFLPLFAQAGKSLEERVCSNIFLMNRIGRSAYMDQ